MHPEHRPPVSHQFAVQRAPNMLIGYAHAARALAAITLDIVCTIRRLPRMFKTVESRKFADIIICLLHIKEVLQYLHNTMASIEEQSPSCADGVTDSAESTVPFSDSHFAAIEQMYRSQDHPDLDLGHPSYTQATRQHIPLHHLDIESQPFRILLYPQDCTSLRTNTGIWITIPCKPSGHSPQRAHCMVVTQGSEDIGCEILSPLECIFYYGPGGDVLQLLNKAPILPLHVQSLNQDDIVEEAVEPRKTAALRPGSYKLRVQDNPPVYVVVSTREHSLSYIPRPNVFRLSGTKRASASPTTTITPSSSRPSALAITCPITSIASTSGGQTILLRDTHGAEYSFTRLKTIATTSACQVFEARHSWYGDRVVIVKCLQFADGKSPRHRGETWLHEYQIHKELKFVRAYLQASLWRPWWDTKANT